MTEKWNNQKYENLLDARKLRGEKKEEPGKKQNKTNKYETS